MKKEKKFKENKNNTYNESENQQSAQNRKQINEDFLI